MGANSDRSVNITISHRGMVALREIGCADHVESVATPISGRCFLSEERQSTFIPYSHRDGDVLYSVRRNDLQRILIECAEGHGVRILYGHKLVRVNSQKKECTFSKEGEIENLKFGFLFGADGIQSQVRQSLHVNSTSTIDGFVYKKIEVDADNAQRLGLTTNYICIWPCSMRCMFLSLPNRDGSHSGLLHMPTTSLELLEASIEYMGVAFPVLMRSIDGFSDKFLNSTTSSFGRIDCKSWFWRGSILLLGDAAHAMVPFYGQGTNCGLEDVRVLVGLIKCNRLDITKAAGIYAEIRPKSTSAISRLSLRNLENLHVKSDFSEYQTQKHIELALEQTFSDYRSEYSRVAFSDTPYEVALEISNHCSPILAKYAKLPHVVGKTSFSLDFLDEVYNEVMNSVSA